MDKTRVATRACNDGILDEPHLAVYVCDDNPSGQIENRLYFVYFGSDQHKSMKNSENRGK
jgi:hypothetical protein